MSDTPQMYMQTANEAQLLILKMTGITTYKYETRGAWYVFVPHLEKRLNDLEDVFSFVQSYAGGAG